MTRVETSLERTSDAATFVVRTDQDAFRAALPGLGYGARDDTFARSFPAGAHDLDRIHERFAGSIEAVLEQAAGLRPTPWEDALADVTARLEAARAEWFLVGSVGLAVRGIEVAPRDVDFVTGTHYRFVHALSDALIEPPSNDGERLWIAGWFGRAFLGARVEWVADVYGDHDGLGGPMEFGPAAASRLERVPWRGRTILVAPLDLQLAVAQARGLGDRVEAIERFMRRTRRSGGR
jgi:hypothetical protein